MNDHFESVRSYYDDCLLSHGPTARGVDWNSAESQLLRFSILHEITKLRPTESVLDVGCGFGSFLGFLRDNNHRGAYSGIDISQNMIETAIQLFPEDADAFVVTADLSSAPTSSIVVASGLFNVRAGTDLDIWTDYVDATIVQLASLAESRLALNFLSTHSDQQLRDERLHYDSIGRVADLLANAMSRRLRIRQDYGLYEFTICAEKV
ncbi:MAG: class I SAM-dependent methyltransferase [Candidatus Latescibacteria bacterium]|nr:class I SAM-dependent methyltransferase [Candidatus Latescibacterota bacterium]